MNNDISSGKKLPGKSGQAAIEFIMTYGWAMMIILIAIGSLSYFGFMNPQKALPDKCVFGNGIICQDSRLNTGMVQVSLYNGLGKTIYDVTLDSDDLAISGCVPANIASASTDTQMRFNCTFTSRLLAGDTKKYKFTATYKRTSTGYVQNAIGEVYGTVQS